MKRESDDNKFLQGNFAPWRLEGQAPDLEIEGKLRRGIDNPIPPRFIEATPLKDVVRVGDDVDLYSLPIPKIGRAHV